MRQWSVLVLLVGMLIAQSNADLVSISLDSASILRFDEDTGAFLGTLVPAGSGGLSSPRGLAYGSDGDLYVTDLFSNSVLRYRGSDGSFVSAFVPSGGGGLSRPRNLTFGPDGNLYVVSRDTDSVLRYSGTTGAFLGVFVSSRSGGLETSFSGRTATCTSVLLTPATCSATTVPQEPFWESLPPAEG